MMRRISEGSRDLWLNFNQSGLNSSRLTHCTSKYERLGIDWELKDAPLIEKERTEELKKIAREEGIEVQ